MTTIHRRWLALVAGFACAQVLDGLAQSPSSLAGQTIQLTIATGSFPFANNGSFRFLPSATDNFYAIVPINGGPVASAGTYSYTKSGTATAQLSLTDVVSGSLTADCSFTTSGSGTYTLRSTSFPGGSQTGTFFLYSGASPTSVAGNIITVTITSGAPPFASSGIYQFFPAASGNTYNILGLSNIPNSSGTYSYNRNSSTTSLVSFNDSIVGSGFTLQCSFDSPTSGTVFLYKSATSGYETGTFLLSSPSTVAPTISVQPQSQTVAAGGSVTFTLTAAGTPPLSYQWRKNGISITGATGSSYTISNLQPSDAGGYSVLVSNLAGSITSSPATLTVTVPPPIVLTPYTFITLAGSAVAFPGSADGTASAARFNAPIGLTVDGAGNVYVADANNNTIRKVTPTGVVTTLAGQAPSSGSVDGTGSTARFDEPIGVAVDGAGNIYVADANNNTIRKVTPTGVVTTLAGQAPSSGSADGMGSAARFHGPTGLAVDGAGNVYVADTGNQTIRKVTPTGAVTTLAGQAGSAGTADGTGSAARFHCPRGLAVDGAGNVYVADECNQTIREVTPAGVVTTLAGQAGSFGSADGTKSAVLFDEPTGVAVDGAGNVYVADSFNNTIRKVTPTSVVTTLAGGGKAGSPASADGTGSAVRFDGPTGVAVDSAGNVYVADANNNTIRKGWPEQVTASIVTSGLGFGFNGAQFGFTLGGPLGGTVVVEASTDLASWMPVWTNTVTGALNYSDPRSSIYSKRFYRVRINGAITNAMPSSMALIPDGSFTMGNALGGSIAEVPTHTVKVSAFYMDKYLVTEALWDQVYQWAIKHGYSFDNAGSGKAAKHPVVIVSWYDVVKWCNARSEQEGRVPAYYTSAAQTTVYRSGQLGVQNAWVNWSAGYRLPTEAEWEKAARGGLSGKVFPWGDTISWGQANYYSPHPSYSYDLNPTFGFDPAFAVGYFPYTSPVGSFAPNGYGLYDMAGNAWEWCWDWFDAQYYSSSPSSNPRGPASGAVRVYRGGGWSGDPDFCEVARRMTLIPVDRTDNLGFRSVLATGQP